MNIYYLMYTMRRLPCLSQTLAFYVTFLVTVPPTEAINLNLSSIDSITSVASAIAYDMMGFYKGNQTGQIPGMLPYPNYYWWESGAMWGSLIDYWYITNDSTYNDMVEQGMLFQIGPNWDFMPPNQTVNMGNDDQGFWALSAMTAAESNFQNPPEGSPQWLTLVQGVFNDYVARVQLETPYCGGGLRWQIFPFSNGWTYKNSIANGCFFNLGSRLARYTGNDTYATWAETIWDWIVGVGVIELQPYNEASSNNFSVTGTGAGGYVVWDGASVQSNCTDVNRTPFTYNAGIWTLGAAMMYNYTNGSALWANRTQLLLNATINIFFPDGVAFEPSCESTMTCDVDQLSFKAYLTRDLALVTQLAPFTASLVLPVLASSAAAAASQCCGGANGRMCGFSWKDGSRWDGTTGVGQQMAAMQVILGNLIDSTRPPLRQGNGATSVGNGGTGPSEDTENWGPPTLSDKVGAAVLTVALAVGMVVLSVLMSFDQWIDAETEKMKTKKGKELATDKAQPDKAPPVEIQPV